MDRTLDRRKAGRHDSGLRKEPPSHGVDYLRADYLRSVVKGRIDWSVDDWSVHDWSVHDLRS